MEKPTYLILAQLRFLVTPESIYLLNKYLLKVYYVPALSGVEQRDCPLHSLRCNVETYNKQVNKQNV